MTSPRIVWLMLPAGAIVDSHVEKISLLLDKGDIAIDGGNSHYRNDIINFKKLGAKEVFTFSISESAVAYWGMMKATALWRGSPL